MTQKSCLQLKKLGIDTHREAVIYMRSDCLVCSSEGFEVPSRIRVSLKGRYILATVNTIENSLLKQGEASLSNYAWKLLNAQEGDKVFLAHPKPLQSLSFVRAKIYEHELSKSQINQIIKDISKSYYSDIEIATFLTACAGGRLSNKEVIDLTRAMINAGKRLTWHNDMIVDKHCVGGLPGNRTTLIVVPIVAEFGLTMPKTSSRSITSPAGTADTMETLTDVTLDLKSMQKVVGKENACIVWGGAVSLSPADDILIRVERAMDLDSEGQLIASVLSKKIAAGSTHIAIDIPVGATAKVRSLDQAESLANLFKIVAKALGIHLNIMISDGTQPVGRGIGPALEAKDVLQVLQNKADAPQDLRDRALSLAGMILEFSPGLKKGEGKKIANQILSEGRAWKKFQAICEAQGGMREPPTAAYTHSILAKYCGRVVHIDNRQISRLAKLAGAPNNKSAGVYLYTPLEADVEKDEPLYTIHAESKGELHYALSLLKQIEDIVQIEAHE